MISAVLGYTAAAAFAAGLLVGGWVAYDWLAPKQFAKGFAAGEIEAQAKAAAAMAIFVTTLKADSLALQQKESARVREIDRIRQAATEADRVQLAQDAGAAALELQRVIGRLRAAETTTARAIRAAGRSSRVPGAAAAAGGTDGPPACGLLPAGRGEAHLRLSAEADEVARQYRLCLAQFPKLPELP